MGGSRSNAKWTRVDVIKLPFVSGLTWWLNESWSQDELWFPQLGWGGGMPAEGQDRRILHCLPPGHPCFMASSRATSLTPFPSRIQSHKGFWATWEQLDGRSPRKRRVLRAPIPKAYLWRTGHIPCPCLGFPQHHASGTITDSSSQSDAEGTCCSRTQEGLWQRLPEFLPGLPESILWSGRAAYLYAACTPPSASTPSEQRLHPLTGLRLAAACVRLAPCPLSTLHPGL